MTIKRSITFVWATPFLRVSLPEGRRDFFYAEKFYQLPYSDIYISLVKKMKENF